GLRLVLALGIPAAVGLVLLAQPLTALLFERGEFTAEDSARAARMVACYSVAIWAYCALPVLVRGFYALGDTAMPARVAAVMVGLNVVLDLMLIWPLAEAGLAISTAIAAMIQVTCLAVLFARRGPGLEVGPLTATVVRSALAASAMAGVLLVILPIVPGGPWLVRAATLGLAIAAGAASYILGFTLLGGREFWHVWRRGKAEV
ncbi:MAG: lipid II flippase MurJ, partial [Planctomycetota bacterium]